MCVPWHLRRELTPSELTELGPSALCERAGRETASLLPTVRTCRMMPEACAEAVAARRAARAATHHPELVPLSRFGAQDAATVYGPLFFPLVTCVCTALWHEAHRARSARSAKQRNA